VEHFVARQPIFDRSQKVFAYELLFRAGLDNYFDDSDPDQASSRVIADSFLLFGIEELTGNALAFINFTRNLLVKEFALALPANLLVVEVLETVEPEDDVLAACRRLKKKGYKLALDDFVYHEKFRPLLDLADVVKVDFLNSTPEERRALARGLIPSGVKLLAEKVETREHFDEGMELGYSYFQGYFFCKPIIVSQKDIPPFKLHFLRILQEMNRPEMDFGRLANTIESEVAISYKLLRYINSAAFGLRTKVGSIRQAVTLLGENEIRKWASLLALSNMASDKPLELVLNSLIRAKFCELVGQSAGLLDRRSDLFLMGLFSRLDAVLGRPMEDALSKVPVAEEVRKALLGERNRFRSILAMFDIMERAAWDKLGNFARELSIGESVAAKSYIEAIQFPRTMLIE
jgi:EAL and modified HD-GYP domain-containing signal transduction protein